jgi:hypothetical protein
MDEKNLEQLVETKLTKTELIEVLISEMKASLDDKAAALKEEVKRIDQRYTVDDILELIGSKEVSIQYFENTYERPYYKIELSVRVAPKDMPGDIKEQCQEVTRLNKEVADLNQKSYKLNARGARTTILKTLLEGSTQGREFLRLLEGLKLKVSTKLLSAKSS